MKECKPMEIYVIDELNGIIGLIDNFSSAIFNVQYFSRNDFQITVAGTPENIDLLQMGRLLCRGDDMLENEYHNVMRIEGLQLNFDSEKGWILKVTGKGLKNILSKRIVWSQTTTTGSVEAAIRQVITENVISPTDSSRAISNFILDTAQGFTDTADIQLLGENIAEWLESTCQTYGYGWDVYIKNGKYTFKLYKGTDRSYNQNINPPVVFSPEYDNLLSSTYTYNKENFKNAALIGGEGEGISKRTASIGSATGLNRSETYIDGSSVSSNGEIITVEQYTAMLENYGQEQLSSLAFTKKFDGEIDPNGIYKLNQDYFLGDVVQIENNGITAVTRIVEIIYSEDENGISVIPTFTEWEVDN